MPASNRIRLYREFLTPALHRRFTQAAGVSLLICYAEAVIIGDKSSSKRLPQKSPIWTTNNRSQFYGHGSHLAKPAFALSSSSSHHSLSSFFESLSSITGVDQRRPHSKPSSNIYTAEIPLKPLSAMFSRHYSSVKSISGRCQRKPT